MKRFIGLFLIYTLMYHSCNAFNNGSLIGEATQPNDVLRYRLQFVTDRQLYTSGGITVNYPFNFADKPCVYVSVELVNAFDPQITYDATVTSNLVGSAVIQVNKLVYDGATLTTISEAPSGDVFVSVLAIGE